MGKKGKGNKLAKMSEEERARYLQMRADIEEETRRRKMQLLALYMKNKLKKEDAFCRLNIAKINQEWRTLLRQIKCADLRQEMREVEQFSKEALERKNQRIEKLFGELDVAEEMLATLQQAHMATIEKLIETQRQRIAFFRINYANERDALLAEYKQDLASYRNASDNAQIQLECVMYQLEDQAKKRQAECDEHYLERVDELNGTVQFNLEEITRKGEQRLESIWQQYQDILSGYVKHTETFYAEYMDLKERDEENTEVIRENCREIERATEQLSQLKLIALDIVEDDEVKIDYMTKVKNELCQKLTELREQVDREMNEATERFKLMSVVSHETLEELKKHVGMGEKILQLISICRKFETEREKVLPFGLPPVPRIMFEKTDDEQKQPPAEMQDDCFDYLREMELFWKRANGVATDVLCLKEHKKQLEAENARLRAAVQEHLIDLNISNGTNTHVNDYLSKRPSSMRIERVVKANFDAKKVKSADVKRLRPLHMIPPFVEANFTSAVRSKSLMRNKSKSGLIETRINFGNECKEREWRRRNEQK